MWILQSLDPDVPVSFRLLPGSMKTLGRAQTVDFVVDAALISRVHCRFTLDAGGLGIEDLGSTNGTYVNGQRIDRASLMNGDTIKIGRVEFAVRPAQ